MAVQILLIPLSTSINIASVALALATPWDLPPSMFSRLQPIAGILAALLLGISLFAKAGAAVLLRFPGMQGFKAISWAFGCGQRLCIVSALAPAPRRAGGRSASHSSEWREYET